MVLMVFNWFLPFRDEYLSQFEGREDRRLYVDDIFQQLTEVRKANWNFLYTCIKNFYCLSAVRDILCDCSLLFLLPVGRNYGRRWRCEKRYRRKSKAWVNMLLLTEWAFKIFLDLAKTFWEYIVQNQCRKTIFCTFSFSE